MEIMNDEQLDAIAGSYNGDTSGDSKFLNDIGTGCPRFGAYKAALDGEAISEVVNHWAKYGVRCYLNNPNSGNWVGKKNSYYIGGRKVSRLDAMKYVLDQIGKNIGEDELNSKYF